VKYEHRKEKEESRKKGPEGAKGMRPNEGGIIGETCKEEEKEEKFGKTRRRQTGKKGTIREEGKKRGGRKGTNC